MSIREINFASANGRDTVKGWSYGSIQKPRAVVQLMHGFGEHSRRYLHMIDSFLEAGIAVCADDHIGHGKTAYDTGTLGDPGTSGVDGFKFYLEDERRLHDIAAAQYPGLPYFLFGHSWGSMLARGYAAEWGEDISGLLLCGVVSQLRGCEDSLRDPAFEEEILSGRGAERGGKWMDMVFGGINDRCVNSDGSVDLISADPRIAADHACDPFNCTSFTTQLLFDFAKLYEYIEGGAWAARLPEGMPAYLFAGDNDPYCNYGEGLYHVANLLASAGHRVTVRAYSGYRHEVHNERAIRHEVEQGMIDFIDGVLA